MTKYRVDSVEDLYNKGFRDLEVTGVGEFEAALERIEALESAIKEYIDTVHRTGNHNYIILMDVYNEDKEQ